MTKPKPAPPKRPFTREVVMWESRLVVPIADFKRWPKVAKPVTTNVSTQLRRFILLLDPICVWCRHNPSTTIDHVLPRIRGGRNTLENMVGCCVLCNKSKAYYLPKELGWKLRLPQRAFLLGDDYTRRKGVVQA